MAEAHALLDKAPVIPSPEQKLSDESAHSAPAILSPAVAGRMFKRLMPGRRAQSLAETSRNSLPRPVQLALPLSNRPHGNDAFGLDDHALVAAPLFREARRIEPVLSFERASLDQIVPDAEPPSSMPHDRLVLPGGTGLVLHEGVVGAMACDWMQWGRKSVASSKDASADALRATIDTRDLRKGSRGAQRLARCIIPVMRYSVPVRDGAIWSHRWMAPAQGAVACIAGIWTAERGSGPTFAMVTGFRAQDEGGPLILDEDELFLWLRAPLGDALTILAERRARAELLPA